ncbi:MAG: hypothetical protein WCI41_00670 [bacterium]
MKNNIIPVILIGIVITGFFAFIKPTYDQTTVINTRLASYDEALSNAKNLKNERDKLTKIYNSIDPKDLEKLRVLLPDNVDNIRLILEIEGIAKPYGMTLKDVKYDAAPDTKGATANGAQAVKQSGYGTWNLAFSTEASYTNFVSFLKDLESNLRIIDIESIDFSPSAVTAGANQTPSNNYKYNIKFKTYWLKN